jgi:hypothetical protein
VKLHISPDLVLPLDAVTQTIVVYGGKGMGKTNFGGVLVEELVKCGRRFAVLDPIGNWYGLRYDKSGKRDGLKVLILGGKHGDIPIEPTGGAVVADLVADEDVDVVVDISRRPNGSMWSLGERTRFVGDYCSRLYERQGERKRPLMQVIDEAGRFAPQMIPHGNPDVARCVGAVERMVEEGRNVGIGVCLITQRSARMNKSVSELAECMVAFRTVGPRSVDAILDWFGEHVEKAQWKEMVEKLRALPKGAALVVSPGWLGFEGSARIRMRETFDSSATPTEAGERPLRAGAAKPDLEKYQMRMAATIERAKQEDPRLLRQRVAELERELRNKAPVAAVEKTVEKIVEVPILTDAQIASFEAHIKRLEDSVKYLDKQRDALAQSQQVVVLELGSLTNAINDAKRGFRTAVQTPATQPKLRWRPTAPVAALSLGVVERSSVVRVGPNGLSVDQVHPPEGVNDGMLRILRAMADRHPARLTEGQVAALSKYTSDGGAFRGNYGKLRKMGMIEGGARDLRITDAGVAAVGGVPDRSAAPLDAWREALDDRARDVFDVIVAAYPKGVHLDEVKRATNYQEGGAFRAHVGFLRRNDIITKDGDTVRASDDLFMTGVGAR